MWRTFLRWSSSLLQPLTLISKLLGARQDLQWTTRNLLLLLYVLDKIYLSTMTETTIDKQMFEHMNLKGIGQVDINGKPIKKALTNHL
jgi:hypothetical protein